MNFDPLGYAVQKSDAIYRELRDLERRDSRFRAEMRAALLVIHSRLDALESLQTLLFSLARKLGLILIPALIVFANAIPESVLAFIAKALAVMLGGG